jgi:MYXO-CTERM domain-containing protein
LWYGGRFGTPDGGNIDDDIVMRNLPSIVPDQGKYCRFEDEAGILFNISTLGYTNVSLSFDWLTQQIESNDRFVAGYYVGDIDFVNDTADGSNPNQNLAHLFNVDGPTWGSSWTELLRDTNPNTWDTEKFMLPSNQASVWVAFWMDNGESDLGKVDNIFVKAEAIPAPAAIALLGLGGFASRRRRTR